ncbi:hypothetical protein CR513_48013, partial [Mucuna pruriens]
MDRATQKLWVSNVGSVVEFVQCFRQRTRFNRRIAQHKSFGCRTLGPWLNSFNAYVREQDSTIKILPHFNDQHFILLSRQFKATAMKLISVLELILAAHRYGIKRVILPERNLKDLVEVPSSVLANLESIAERPLGGAVVGRDGAGVAAQFAVAVATMRNRGGVIAISSSLCSGRGKDKALLFKTL